MNGMAKGNGKGGIEQQLLDELRKGFAQVTERLDRIIENTGTHWREHEKRLQVIEEKLGIAR